VNHARAAGVTVDEYRPGEGRDGDVDAEIEAPVGRWR
jgi:hypothetical protein